MFFCTLSLMVFETNIEQTSSTDAFKFFMWGFQRSFQRLVMRIWPALRLPCCRTSLSADINRSSILHCRKVRFPPPLRSSYSHCPSFP